VHGGDKIRIVEICRQLAKSHRLILVACCDKDVNEIPELANELFAQIELIKIPRWRSYINCLLALGFSLPLQVAYYRDARYRAKVEKLLQRADIVLAHLIRTAQYVPPTFRGFKVLEITDAISLVLQRARFLGHLGKFMSLISRIEMRRVERYERHCMSVFDLISVVSDVDAGHLRAQQPPVEARLIVATNGVGLANMVVPEENAKDSVIFIGNMRTLPNLDACDYFIRECFPLILGKYPGLVFRIVGPITKRAARKLHGGRSGVEIVGEVDELTPFIAKAFCGVAPMRRGGGIQNKILEYLAHGLPCVTTAIGYEGLQARMGDEIIVADTPAALAEAVLTMKTDRARRQAVGQAGMYYVRNKHNWDRCLAPLTKGIYAGSKSGAINAVEG
jgi:glycosyltransferase involved in cell wall biosynthesis